MSAFVGLFLVALGAFVYLLGRVPTMPGPVEAFASHVPTWRTAGTGIPKLCFSAVVLMPSKLVVFVLGFPKIVIHSGDVKKVSYHGGRGLMIESSQYKVRLFVKYPREWHELIDNRLNRGFEQSDDD